MTGGVLPSKTPEGQKTGILRDLREDDPLLRGLVPEGDEEGKELIEAEVCDVWGVPWVSKTGDAPGPTEGEE